MRIKLQPRKYIVAVSGGVDSVALLDILQREDGLDLVVAHFDHGMREDSGQDRVFVRRLAKDYELPFEYKEGRLGSGASEADARDARYGFLRETKKFHGAAAIITAHHQDDVLETAIINLLRGTGRKGLTALGSQGDIERPLLNVSKQELINYAKKYSLEWREDSTNQNTDYLRNYVRHEILSRFDARARDQLLGIIKRMRFANHELDALLVNQLSMESDDGALDRQEFSQLPHAVAKETMAAWLREKGVRDFDSRTLERLVVAAKVARPGREFNVMHNLSLVVDEHNLALASAER